MWCVCACASVAAKIAAERNSRLPWQRLRERGCCELREPWYLARHRIHPVPSFGTVGRKALMLCSTISTAASPPSDAPRRIVPLPHSVTARLRSTLAITTLAQAVSELVQNSLDANPRHIKIQVNFLRNSCVVEDDGCGIPPDDVPLLGKRYCAPYPLQMKPIKHLLTKG